MDLLKLAMPSYAKVSSTELQEALRGLRELRRALAESKAGQEALAAQLREEARRRALDFQELRGAVEALKDPARAQRPAAWMPASPEGMEDVPQRVHACNELHWRCTQQLEVLSAVVCQQGEALREVPTLRAAIEDSRLELADLAAALREQAAGREAVQEVQTHLERQLQQERTLREALAQDVEELKLARAVLERKVQGQAAQLDGALAGLEEVRGACENFQVMLESESKYRCMEVMSLHAKLYQDVASLRAVLAEQRLA